MDSSILVIQDFLSGMTARESADDSGGSINLTLTRFERYRASHPVFATELPDPGTGIVLERFRAELSCKICCNLLKDPVLSRVRIWLLLYSLGLTL